MREYLTSVRIANSAPVSHFHIPPKLAHTLLARACLSVLLQLDNSVDETKIHNFPLAWYAAEHRVGHVLFQGVSLDIQNGMYYPSTRTNRTWLRGPGCTLISLTCTVQYGVVFTLPVPVYLCLQVDRTERIRNKLDSPRGVCPLTVRCIRRGHETVGGRTPVVRGEDRVLMVPQSKG